MSEPEVGAVVVGSGIAGLAAALELERLVGEVVLLDASDRPGGVMRTDHVAGYVIERGPNTVQVKPPMAALLERLGLGRSLRRAEPESRRRFLYRDGALVPVPLSPLAFARSPLLSWRGKLRLLVEPVVRRGDATGESVAEFASRRFGREVASGLVGPFLTGVYAGDETRLGAEAVFPGLVQAERRAGSIALGLAAGALGRRGARGPRGSHSVAEGLGPLARQLAARLAVPPVLETRVRSLAREGVGWRIEASGAAGDLVLRTRRAVLATGAREASELLRDVDGEVAQALAGIEHAPIAGVAVCVDPERVRLPIEGFGFLAPHGGGLDLLGCLFMSRLFPGRAPAGRELLHCILGGTRRPELVELPDDALGARVAADLDRVLGLAEAPRTLAVTRWPRAIAQPGRDHPRRIAEARARLGEKGGLELAGGYLDGVAVADALASGLRAADALAGS